ncbi:hypothetical protein [Streptomyces sp. SID1121]|uniref:hypothetical protein n=1 Tax=Streptomyces sp. SID1121 TaxID=3425888 RepID=UPI004055C95E
MPSHHLPLLLTAYQYRFRRDLEAMSRHLIDDVSIGWDELGTDLLDGAPHALVTALTGAEQWPSLPLDHLMTPAGTNPPARMTITDTTADTQGMQWGYVLHRQGIEVIPLPQDDRGPIVDWSTNPLTAFNDHPGAWSSLTPTPVVRAACGSATPSAPASPPANTDASHAGARR